MLILAFEMSSSHPSVALTDGKNIQLSHQWSDPRLAGKEIFDVLKTIPAKGISWGDIDAFAVGRGPGNYSGLRASITMAQSLALPNDTPVFTLSSGLILADSIFSNQSTQQIRIVGDARRNELWHAAFTQTKDGATHQNQSWERCSPEDFLALSQKAKDTCLASSEYVRITSIYPALYSSGSPWIESDTYPHAERLALATTRAITAGCSSDPVTPIYMHPAVATKEPSGQLSTQGD
ncbi:MAG: tRNA (adenosine(37)-N6)-threonylcarbamoyltransferase complex dimerization subunit type 1 TsaB [Spartobacteria bacterium]|nr:tRNA (adenosine(37)-N6)-threonylcarbamoyltransferase complex dimerization subunit type 1 TsaB [Spartobacteria bacterium]